jgi:molecular chaperone DnaK
MGIVALDVDLNKKYNSILLPKNTAIPLPEPARDIYSTVVDNQTGIQVEVTEGEGEDLEFVRIIGKGTMKIPPYPKGAPVEVFFQYDNNGIIHISVHDLTAKKMLGEMTIERKSNRTKAEVDSMTQQIAAVEVQ